MHLSAVSSRALCRSGRFNVRFWDGTSVAATEDGAPTFLLQHPRGLAHFIAAPGTLGLGRAYVDGSLAVDDLDAAFLVVDDWEPPPLSVAERARLGLALLAAAARGGLPRRPELELILRGELPQRRARRGCGALPLRRRQRVLRAVPRRVDDLQLRDLLARRAARSRRRSAPSWS